MMRLMRSMLAFWNAKNPKEKKLIFIVSGLVLTLLLLVMWFIPIIHERQQLIKLLPELRHQITLAEVQAHQISLLTDQQDKVSEPEISLEMLKENLISVGLNPKKIIAQKNNIILEFDNTSFSKLIGWSHDAQIKFHLVVVDASISPLNQLDQVNAILTYKKLI
ncbi:MAG: ral secretion pathway protein [Pseudomonadota bacterium]